MQLQLSGESRRQHSAERSEAGTVRAAPGAPALQCQLGLLTTPCAFPGYPEIALPRRANRVLG